MKKYFVAISAIAPFLTFPFMLFSAVAQISAAPDGTNTIVNQTGNTFNITNGTQSGSNQFHSFQQFGLTAGQIANFQSNPAIQNILGRVTGGNSSVINGQIQVTGSNANLYLMNPAGIVFGPGASLNVPASFAATTANGIRLNDNWFNATGANNYPSLNGTPNALGFTMLQPGAIVNAGNLAVGNNQNLVLVGGTIVNTGTLTAPNGQVAIATVSGNNIVQLSTAGGLLNLEIRFPSIGESLPTNWTTPIVNLPTLLTGSGLISATGIVQNSDGSVSLVGSSLPIEAGGVAMSAISAPAGGSNVRIQAAGDVEIRMLGDVRVGDVDGRAVTVATNGSIQTGNIKARGYITDDAGRLVGVNLNSRGDIQTGHIEATESVNLNSSQGNIVVRSIDTRATNTSSVVEVNITTPGLFQATGTTSNGVSTYRIVRANIDAPENSDIKQFLITQGVLNPDGSINPANNSRPVSGGTVKPVVDSDRTVVVALQDVPLSIVVREGDPGGRVRIQHGGQSVNTDNSIRNRDGSKFVEITGSGGSAQFVVGPQVNRLPAAAMEIVNDYTAALSSDAGFGSRYSGPAIRYQTFTPLAVGSEQFPSTASGTVGAIATGAGTNTNAARAFLNIPFVPVSTPTSQSSNPTTSPPASSSRTPVVGRNVEQVVRQDLNRQTQVTVCTLPTTVATAATTSETRSPNSANTPCTSTANDAQILKILGEDNQPMPR